MIDICPVGALTSKPFRYSARTWELSRRKSVSPHDSTGANLIVQVKNNQVMRVVPLENEDVNECWIADRDRFSYEALNGAERLTQPMLKQGGQWQTGRLADRARIRGQRPEADQGRPRRAEHRRAGQPAQHARRTAPGQAADARPGQRQHRLPPAQRRVHARPKACAGSAPRSRRCRSCSACWSSAPTCARTIRCSRSASARRRARAARCSASLARTAPMPTPGPCRWRTRRSRRAGQWVAGAGRHRRRHRRRARASRRPSQRRRRATRPRRIAAVAARRRAQGHPAGQRRRAPCRRLAACWRWPTGSASRPAPASAT